MRDLLVPGIEPMSPALAGRFLLCHQGSPSGSCFKSIAVVGPHLGFWSSDAVSLGLCLGVSVLHFYFFLLESLGITSV